MFLKEAIFKPDKAWRNYESFELMKEILFIRIERKKPNDKAVIIVDGILSLL